ncbi:response regulator transcription factor [Brucepastera parasyntrophica]|uniref:response regulator transcription factor n=1 Tax=Brucepastera parasyntrophica TaxID=2880008 RepID=UPI00210A83C2|nr:response regulator transcription factor [Brucepastera parasyntrophica]ULQ60866.1 response regulator transcription factor [Brucepastera parasyntrophica]
MKANVLIIEDVRELSELVELYLTKEGLAVKSAESAEDALAILESWTPDLIILDINLPGMDGFEFLHQYRRSETTPVLIVSARSADEDIISGLGYGADEFVTKPFSPRVLVARVRAMLRRNREDQTKSEAKLFRFGPFTIDFDACILKKENEKIPLSAKEYGVLAFLAEAAGKPQSPEQIYSAVWKNLYGDITTVAVYIQRLRKKIEDDPSVPVYLETVHGMGYRLNTGADS